MSTSTGLHTTSTSLRFMGKGEEMNGLPFSVYPIAFAFVAWQALAKFTGAPGTWVGPLVLVGSLIGASAFGWRGMSESNVTMASASFVLGLGIVNGVAIFYNVENLTNPKIPTGMYLLILTIIMAVMGPLIDAIMSRTIPNPWQFAAVASGALTIYLAGK